ncbi:hypothetical protein GCM10017600_20160 [Streptosporangium carneum]|uniref:Uncharacterized protein n=1 Tax=Streptosporangium carneum TaxID=47481 RepID=A0A9W6HYE7_9ACTN|nr:hypothetical protein GCM10017600_20160 [Streptosporangium carneum]
MSNPGGRQLDGAVPGSEMLGEIAAALSGGCEVPLEPAEHKAPGTAAPGLGQTSYLIQFLPNDWEQHGTSTRSRVRQPRPAPG